MRFFFFICFYRSRKCGIRDENLNPFSIECTIIISLWFKARGADCSMNYYNATGTLTSPNYPEPTNHREECDFFVKIATADSIRIVFDFFDTEGLKDVLTFGSGPLIDVVDPNNYLELHGNLSNLSSADLTYVFATNQVWFNWLTDRNIDSNGFTLSWDAGKFFLK